MQTLTQDKITGDSKAAASVSDSKSSGTAVADLVDLELELNSLQQGLNQMERITPSDPFGSKDDPFGDSFISYPVGSSCFIIIESVFYWFCLETNSATTSLIWP